MSGAILTGSRVYGTPTPASDLDMVVSVTQEELEILKGRCPPQHQDDVAVSAASSSQASLRFGNLNLIVLTSEDDFDNWRIGTEELKARKPVTREEAKAVLKKHCGDE